VTASTSDQVSRGGVSAAPWHAKRSRRFAGSPGIGFVSPAMLLIALVLIAPSIYGAWFSLHRIRFLAATDFIWFGNYTFLFTDPHFLPVVLRTVVFTVASVMLTMVLGLALAVWVNRIKGTLGLILQIVIILPWIISHVVGALLYKWVVVNDLGLGRYIMEQLGQFGYDPLSDPVQAMIILIIYSVWRHLGFVMLLMLSGLKSIPADLYEAAHVDGANAWQRFVRITLPLLRTPMLIAVVIETVANINNIEGPLVVTGGGPAGSTNVLAHDLYVRAFVSYDYSTALALGISMFIFNIVLAISYVKLVNRNG
jgi:ABC-type sugar transport system permease subunit